MYVCMYIYIYNIFIVEHNYSETRLLLYVHEQFTMSLHLLCSAVIRLWLLIFSANNSAVER